MPWLDVLSSIRMIPVSCSQLGHRFPYLGDAKKTAEGEQERMYVKERKGVENGARKQRDRETDNLVDARRDWESIKVGRIWRSHLISLPEQLQHELLFGEVLDGPEQQSPHWAML